MVFLLLNLTGCLSKNKQKVLVVRKSEPKKISVSIDEPVKEEKTVEVNVPEVEKDQKSEIEPEEKAEDVMEPKRAFTDVSCDGYITLALSTNTEASNNIFDIAIANNQMTLLGHIDGVGEDVHIYDLSSDVEFFTENTPVDLNNFISFYEANKNNGYKLVIRYMGDIVVGLSIEK